MTAPPPYFVLWIDLVSWLDAAGEVVVVGPATFVPAAPADAVASLRHLYLGDEVLPAEVLPATPQDVFASFAHLDLADRRCQLPFQAAVRLRLAPADVCRLRNARFRYLASGPVRAERLVFSPLFHHDPWYTPLPPVPWSSPPAPEPPDPPGLPHFRREPKDLSTAYHLPFFVRVQGAAGPPANAFFLQTPATNRNPYDLFVFSQPDEPTHAVAPKDALLLGDGRRLGIIKSTEKREPAEQFERRWREWRDEQHAWAVEFWRTGNNLDWMLNAVGHLARPRQFRLVACACCRRLGPLLDDPARQALEVAEEAADGKATLSRLRAAVERLGELPPDSETDAAAHAGHWAGRAVRSLLGPDVFRVPAEGGGWWPVRAVRAILRSDVLPASEPAGEVNVRNCCAEALVARVAANRGLDDGSPTYAAARAAEETSQCELLREVLGEPLLPARFDPAWRSPAAVALARGMYESRQFDTMPVLGDALTDAGCTDESILAHCRQEGSHVRGCRVVDLVLSLSDPLLWRRYAEAPPLHLLSPMRFEEEYVQFDGFVFDDEDEDNEEEG